MKLERMGLLQGLGSKVKEDLCGLGPEGQQQGVCEVTPAGVVSVCRLGTQEDTRPQLCSPAIPLTPSLVAAPSWLSVAGPPCSGHSQGAFHGSLGPQSEEVACLETDAGLRFRRCAFGLHAPPNSSSDQEGISLLSALVSPSGNKNDGCLHFLSPRGTEAEFEVKTISKTSGLASEAWVPALPPAQYPRKSVCPRRLSFLPIKRKRIWAHVPHRQLGGKSESKDKNIEIGLCPRV